jgi:hypothetical protein
MKNLLALSISLLIVSSVCAKDDYITTAINSNSPDKLEGLLEAQFPVCWEKKEAYLELARQKVASAQKDCEKLSLGGRSLLTNLELLTAAGIVLFTGKQMYDQYNDPKKESWKGKVAFTLALLGLSKNSLGFVKDFSKQEEALKKLKDAKKVLALVELLQIDA